MYILLDIHTYVHYISIYILDDWEAITGCQFNRTSVPQPRLDFGYLAGLV